ncbi:hypothetical protein HYX12_03820 [Candidatus Woesearchaeota archaeon]|nr:hypothetical protein [Candidatus Woesearchaeota archaeon]
MDTTMKKGWSAYLGGDLLQDETIYSRQKREILVEEDVLRHEEDGIMQGYEEGLSFVEDEIDFTDEEDFLESYEEELIV